MKMNVDSIDRILRIVVGLGLLGWDGHRWVGAAMGGPVWAWIGVVPLATGVIGWCPLYALFGFSTCAVKKPQD